MVAKAQSTTSDHERRALMDTVNTLLSTIGLVLPVETTEAIETVVRKELAHR